ncbi:RNA polymerase sigma factor [Cellulomonas soli]|uniref:RNA polymerase sigma factor n=1 Tax=Cellulomonas soli TaxID=931535 RepID=UPI003F864005
MAADDGTRMAELWAAHSRNVLAFASRQVGPDAAQDVLSETFVVACRRMADVPEEPLPWLLVVARNVIRNQQRKSRRGEAAFREMANLRGVLLHEAPERHVAEREALVHGLEQLPPLLREALLLTGWDGLSSEDAARVVGCRPATFRVRLARARRRLTESAERDEWTLDGGATPIVAAGARAETKE